MSKTHRILILEDDLATLATLLAKLAELEQQLQQKGEDLSVMVLSEYTQVQEYVNAHPKPNFDVVLLDRDCKVGGSFHVLDFKKFDPATIISISSVLAYNEETKKYGVHKFVWKDYENLDDFAEQVVGVVTELL